MRCGVQIQFLLKIPNPMGINHLWRRKGKKWGTCVLIDSIKEQYWHILFCYNDNSSHLPLYGANEQFRKPKWEHIHLKIKVNGFGVIQGDRNSMYLGTNIGKGGIVCLLEILCDHYGFQSKSVHNFSSLVGSMCEARGTGSQGETRQ